LEQLPLGTPILRRLLRLPGRNRTAAWVLAIAGPAAITLAALPFRPTVRSAFVLFCTLIAVVAVGILGGIRPTLLAIVVGFLSGAYFFSPPNQGLRASNPVDVVALIAFLVVGGSVGVLIDDLARLAQEQAALRRVATLVARAAPPDEVFAAVTEEVGRLLRVDFIRMGRYGTAGTMTGVGGWNKTADYVPEDALLTLGGNNVATLVSETGRPVRVDRYDESSRLLLDAARMPGVRSSIGTPIIVEGRLWGVMTASTKKRRPLPRETESRLADFTGLVATAIANAESRAALAASRARIVATADETRRRIERDLHDGAQQRLVSLALELHAAQTAVPPELDELKGELSHVAEGLTSTLEDLQEIARGIHPAVLAEGGLLPALKMLARRSAVPVELEMRAGPRLPRSIEVAVYYVVSESLTNVAKYAHASLAHVEVGVVEHALRVSVRDDGGGGADATRGSGLVGLRDRVEALGGVLTVRSPLGAGTTVAVELPLNDFAQSVR
jgi:signal transduction histidine kinase